ncbi:Uncharacterized mitochondrial protein AtMg00810 [Striga hermonthica]|uniref:Uncharacterized mitochondrial protein AtMg00810 n=1 Tax=Striga hermonthica TaxID=68872 RepID=A0A9N7MCC3_STRHE|nr:Uncharacterized mitochondrial protein AtMg00810 [Striga hermonthica]
MRGKLCLTKKQYLNKVLQRFGIKDESMPVSTPLAPHLKLSAQLSPNCDEERKYMARVPYENAVGSLMYAMVCTRPDISQAVGVVSRYMHYPVGYCDSDYAGDLDKRGSTTGYLFTFAKAPVRWKSTLQSTVALSTAEAEYMAVTKAVKEAIWLQRGVGTNRLRTKPNRPQTKSLKNNGFNKDNQMNGYVPRNLESRCRVETTPTSMNDPTKENTERPQMSAYRRP